MLSDWVNCRVLLGHGVDTGTGHRLGLGLCGPHAAAFCSSRVWLWGTLRLSVWTFSCSGQGPAAPVSAQPGLVACSRSPRVVAGMVPLLAHQQHA